MHIKGLHIDGFGIYCDKSLKMDAPLTVFYGPNGAGKSTLMAFIRTVLYGFPSAKAKQWYPPKNGGKHGGRLIIEDLSGEVFTVERHQGPKGGLLNVRSKDGTEMNNGQDIVKRLCGRQPQTVFESVLSFDLGDLPIDSNKKEITSQFYTAAIGANQLQHAEKTLKKRQDEIYTSPRSKKPLIEKLNTLQELDTKLHKVKGQSATYADMTREKTELTTSLQLKQEEKKARQDEHNDVERRVKSWPLWCALETLESRLPPAESRDNDFPADPITRLETCEKTIKECQDNLEKLKTDIKKTKEQTKVAVPYKTLIDESARIHALVKGEQKHQDERRDLKEKRQPAVQKAEDEVTEALLRLGPDWTKPRVENLDLSVTQMAEVDRWKKKSNTLEEESKKRQNKIDTLDDTYRKQECDVSELESSVDKGIEEKVTTQLVQEAVTCYKAYSQALKDSAPSHRSSSGPQPSRWFELTIGALSLSTLALAGWFELLWLGLVGLVGLLGCVILAWLERAKPQDTSTSERGTEQAKVTYTHQIYKKVVGQLGLSDPDSVEVSDLMELDTAIKNRDAFVIARNKLKILEDQKTTVRQEKKEHESRIAAQESEWREWLKARNFPDTLQAEDVQVFKGTVEVVRQLLKSQKEEEKRVYGIAQDMKEYRQAVKALAERHKIPLNESIQDETIWVEEIDQLLDTAIKKQENQENAQKKLTALKMEYEDADAAWQRGLKERENLWKAGKAKDSEEFRRKADDSVQMKKAISEHKEKLGKLHAMWMNEYTEEELVTMYRKQREPDLKNELEHLKSELTTLNNDIKSYQERRAELNVLLETMDGSNEASNYRAEREVALTEANELAEKWSTLVVAQWLLERARRKYENERQPIVIQHASKKFAEITNGDYIKIVPQSDSTSEWSVVDQRERTSGSKELSGGTKDQLWLALRFGLIQSLDSSGETLPIIVDEALVQCDAERIERVAKAFVKLAEMNQVLVMTCWKPIKDLFVKASENNVKVIHVERS